MYRQRQNFELLSSVATVFRRHRQLPMIPVSHVIILPLAHAPTSCRLFLWHRSLEIDINFQSEKEPRWPSRKVGVGGLQVPNPIPLKIYHARGHVKSYVLAKRPPVGVAWKFGDGYQLRCRPRHLTKVQNYEVRPK
ncbi:hypothetical protein AVEN_75119-1 [Araneus ventricosus]|uniref:Uncharacterized protein n=1 Tax=Araneus ventricosus TaxID=182803 RepID=A0A4Y2VGB4_ARAVE|nr:hypothetical protein AVEN_75119-1 [Araneus ventricosus]